MNRRRGRRLEFGHIQGRQSKLFCHVCELDLCKDHLVFLFSCFSFVNFKMTLMATLKTNVMYKDTSKKDTYLQHSTDITVSMKNIQVIRTARQLLFRCDKDL